MNTPPDPLEPILDRWSETPEPSPQLKAAVWQQIALHENRASRQPGIWATLENWLSRPSFAFGFVAGCVALGLLVAEVRLGHLQRERNAQLARSYLLLIDPLLNAPEHNVRS
jgi:hypothetical protein